MANKDAFNNNTPNNDGVFGNSLIDDATLVKPLTDSPGSLGITQSKDKNSGNYDPFASLNDETELKDSKTDQVPVVKPLEQSSVFTQPNVLPVTQSTSTNKNTDALTGNKQNAAVLGASSPDPLTGNNNSGLRTTNTTVSSASPSSSSPNFAIRTEGTISMNGGDYDGVPTNLSDDALIYAAKGFTINGNPTLPVQRDANGNPIRDASGKLVLVDKAVAVSSGYNVTNGPSNQYAGLIPPPVIPQQTVTVTAHADLRQQELNLRVPAGSPTVIFNSSQNPLNNANDWNTKFPSPGTASNPKVVRVTGGGLNIPDNITLNNYVITVDSGDVNFNGNNHNFNNVVLITNNGNINLNNVQSRDLAVFSSGSINMNGGARFAGSTMLASGSNNGTINFNGATTTTNTTDTLRVVSQGDITYNGASNTRGFLLSVKNFIYNGNSTLYGTIGAKGNIIFNSGATVIYAADIPPDTTAPTITASLESDTARNNTTNTDKITSNPTIIGSVTDTSSIAEFKAGFNSTPTANFVNVLAQRNADGSFRFTRTQLEQINGGTFPDGTHTLKLQAKDASGNTTSVYEFTFTLDTTEAAPNNLDLTAITDSGRSDTDNITNNTAPAIAGNANAGALVQLSNSGQVIGSETADSTGKWQITSSTLTNGTYNLTATATDIAGNVSAASQPLSITIDTVAPISPTLKLTAVTDTGASNSDGITKNNTPIIAGTAEANSTVKLYKDGQLVGTTNASVNGEWQVQLGTLANGNHVFTATSTDTAGNISAPSTQYTVIVDTQINPPSNLDLVTPSDSGISNVDNITKVTTPVITGNADANTTVQLFNNGNVVSSATSNASGMWQIVTSDLTDGTYNLNAQATDIAGNVSSISTPIQLIIDRALPQLNLTTPVDTAPLTDYAVLTGNVNGTGSGISSLSYRFDNSSEIAITLDNTGNFNQQLDLSTLTSGSHVLTLVATDIAGNVKTISYNVIINNDTIAPVITAGLKNDTAPSGTINSNPNDGKLSDRITYDPEITGFVTDTSSIASFKAGFNNQTAANFYDVFAQLNTDGSFNFNRTTLEAIYGGTIPDGTHTLRLIASDSYGNTSNAFSFTFTLDTNVAQPTFNLDATSDSDTIGDKKTKFNIVTLTGLTEPGATLILEQTGANGATSPVLGQNGTPLTVTADNTGKYNFTNVELAGGNNTFTVRATDIAGNTSSFSTTIYRFSAPTAINLTPNTVAEYSAVGTVVGELSSIDPDSGDTHTYTLVDSAGGRFKIVDNKLQVANGTLLYFETNTQHTVIIISTDKNGLSKDQEIAIAITNVNEVPIFTSTPASTTVESGNTFTYNITTTDPDIGDARTLTVTGLPNFLTFTDNGNGTAKITGTPNDSQLGLFNIAITATDAGGLKATQNIVIGSQITLTEQTNFSPKRNFPLTIPATASILTFKIDPSFDLTDTKFINDAFEVALVDANGISLVHAISKDRDAFFNLTEGEPAGLGAGATYNPTTKTVSLNLAGIKPGEAQLIFRLVNDDSDTTTSVKITDFALVAAPAGTVAATQTQFAPEIRPSAAPNFNALVDVSNSLAAQYQRTSFNADTKTLYTDIFVRNIGSYSVDTPVLVSVNNISDPTVILRNPDGVTPDGIPYYDFTSLVASGKLNPNGESGSRSLAFYNPQGIQFSYDLIVLAQLNQAPVIQTQPIKEIIGGQFYSYDVNATDPNGDSLTYKLLASPDGMTIDPTTGLINWNTTTSNIGNQIISLEVSDGRGGTITQDYTLSAIATPPNRPPVFVTNPVVEAYINKQYSYDSNAVDPDQDTVSYSVVIGPDGLKIDPTTGKVQWTAPPALILGDTVIGQVSVAGQNQEFNFAGQAGQRLYFDPIQYTGNRGDWKFQVYSPTGRLVVDTYLAYYDNQLITLNEDGNYKIVVDPQGATTGSYGFSVINPALLPIQPFDSVISDKLNPGPADRVYRFNATQGQKLYFDYLSRVNGSLDWALYDSRNTAVAYNGNFDDIEYDVQTSGEYILAVRGKGAFNEINPFSFNIIDSPLPITAYTIGSTANGFIQKGEQDSFTFTGTAGQQLFYDTLNSTNYFPITVYDPTGRQIDSFDSRGDRGPDTPLFLSMSGTYKVIVDGSGETTGDYKFRFLDRASATIVNLDTDIIGTFTDKIQTDSYSFEIPTTPLTPTPNGKQYIYIDGQAGDYNNRYNIYDAAGRNISNAYVYEDRELYLDAGKYWLTLTGNGANNNNYKVRIITVPLTTTAMNLGDTISGTITKKGAQDSFTFTGAAGQQLFYDTLNSTNYFPITVYDPSGKQIDSFDSRGDRGPDTPLFLSMSGAYKVTVDGSSEDTGDYKFRFLDRAAATLVILDTDVIGTFTDKIQTDSYSFEIPTTPLTPTPNGKQYIYIDAQAGDYNNRYNIYDAAGRNVSNAYIYEDRELYLDAGKYWLTLNGNGAANNNYKVRIITAPLTTTAINIGDTISGTIAKKGEQDSFTFTGTAGQQLFYDTLNSTNYFPITVYDPSGKQIDSFDSRGDRGPDTPLFLSMSGAYKVTVDGSGETTEDYKFRFLDRAAATLINLDTDIIDTFTDKIQTDSYSFEIPTTPLTPTPNGKQYIYIDAQAGDYNNRYNIYDAAGRNVSNAYIYEDRELYLDAGKYWLTLNGNGAANNNYKVRIITAPLTTTAINIGDTISGTIAQKGEQDSFTFTGTAGQQLFYDALQPNNYFQYSIYDPTGRKVLDSADSRGDRRPQDGLTLTMNGTYKVTIDGSGEGTGDYKFRFLDRNTAPVATIGGSALTGNFDEIGIGSTSYRFNVVGNQTIKIDGQGVGQYYNYWILYGRDGTQITSDLIYNSKNVGLSEGEYWLVMQGNGAVNNNYSIKLTSISSTPSIDPTSIDYTLNTVVNGNVNSYIVAGSADLGGYPAYRAFDGNLTGEGGFWAANGPAPSIKIDLGSAKSVATYSLLSRWLGEYNQSPHEWVMAGSNDGTNFTTIDTRTQEGVWNISETRNYTLATPNSYRYYKWTFTAISGQSIISVQEITLADSAGKQVIDDKKIYSFDGIAGQNIRFDSQSNSSNIKYTLITPSGREVLNNIWQNRSEIALGETGKYKFVVEGTNGLSSAYQFQLVNYGNGATNLIPIALGDSVSGTFAGGGLEAKLYRFTAAANQYLYIDSVSGDASNSWIIYSPNGVNLTSGNLTQSKEFFLPDTGEYTLVILGKGSANNSFNLKLLTPNQDTTALTIGTAVSGNISTKGQNDVYTFTGTAGQRLYLDILNRTANYYNQIYIDSPTGVRYLSYDPIYNDQNYLEPITLKETGTYKVTMDFSGGQLGTYGFSLMDMDRATPLTFDTIVNGASTTGIITDTLFTGQETRFYKFTGTAGTKLYMDSLIDPGNVYWTLFNSSNQRVMDNAARDDREIILADDTYVLAIRGYESAAKTYKFNLILPPAPAPTPINLGNNATPNLVSGNVIVKGQNDVYTFTGTSGQRLYLDILDRTANYYNAIYIDSPTGVRYLSYDIYYNESYLEPITLKETGTYKVTMDFSGEQLGTYGFSLMDMDRATPLTFDTIVNGASTTGIITDTLTIGQETRFYKFTGTAGTKLYMDSLIDPGNVYWTLFNSSNQRVMDNAARDDREIILADDTYVLAIRGYESAAKTYKFNLILPPPPAPTPINLGNNATPNPVSGNVIVKGQNDVYTFTGTSGQRLYLDILDRTANYYNAIYIDSPTGVRYLSYDIYYNESYLEPITLKETGTYKVTMDFSGEQLGTYGFSLMDMDRATPLTFDAASLDTGIITDTLPSGQNTRFYKFTGAAGEKLFLDSLQDPGNVYWTLFNSSNQRVIDDAARTDREITLADDTYVLAIRGYESAAKTYKFKLVKPTQPVANYTIGDTINGSITRPGQNDSYKFEGKAGQRLFFDSLSGASNFFAQLYAPSGKLVSDGSSTLSNWDIRTNKVNNILDENGIYTLVIDPSGDTIGDYSLRLLEYANAASTGASQSTPIALNTVISGKYDDPKGLKSNLYKFTASAGQTIYVDVTAGTYPNGYSVFSPNGEFVSGQNGIPFGQGYTNRSIVLPFTGDYTIEFYSTGNYSNSSAYDPRNDYSFQLLTPDKIISNYILGTSVNTSLGKKGEIDTYNFTGTIGQKLYFDYVVAPANSRLKFYSPTGVLLNERFLNSGDFLPETLKENGTYRIDISGDNGTTGAYGFTLSDRTSVSIPAIALGTAITDTVNGNNAKLYRINGIQGQILNFDLTAPSWASANWVLYNPAGTALASPSTSTPDFKVTLPSTGLFTLAIGGANAPNLNYNFTVTNIAPAPVTNSGLNTLQSGTLTASTPVNYTFTATAGTQIFYDGQYDSTNGYIRGRIYDPNGVIIADNLDMRYDQAPIVLKETGNYKFQTYSYYGNITGNYKYNLLEMPNSFRSPAATYLAFNGTETGTLNSGEAKVFTFQNFVGTKVLFNGMVGDGVNAYLYDPSGNLVMNFGNFQYYDSPQYVLTQEGLYHLALAGDSGANRNYSFQMLDASSAPTVEYNLPTTGSLDNGQKDVFYTINASAGKRLYFDNLSATTITDINRFTWGLYAPDGSYVSSTNNYIYNDFQYDFTVSGEYTLVIRGQAVTDKLDYKFRVVQTDINNARDIITPGVGKSNEKLDDGSLATVAVKLQAKDGFVGSVFQDYNIKVFADPDNANPVITSTPDTNYSLASDGYRYTLTALDPNNDSLVYRLVNAPVGAVINRDTGELLWFPEATVISGSKANFTVEVSDRRGGKDIQSFTVDVYSQLGKIQGAVFDDLNGNGLLDSKLIKGTNPAVIIAFDVSGSTEAPFYGARNFPNVKVVKDAEVAAIKELAKAIIAQSQGNNVKIGLITFVAGGTIEDMDLSAAGLQEYTTALLDTNNNGITNLNEVLAQQIFADNKFYPPGRSGFDAALTTIRTLLQASNGTPNLIFMSDGYGHLNPVLAASVANDIKTGFGSPTREGNVTALAIGEASTLDTLKEIDPSAIRLTDIESLTTLFGGLDENYNLEPFKENVSVYLDLNNNGVYDPNEPLQKTKRGFAPNSLDKTSYYYTFDNLRPGDYRVRILPPAGYKITTNYNASTASYDPATDQGNGILHQVTTVGETFADFFGVSFFTAPPNSLPIFVTTFPALAQLKSGELLKYNARATDVDSDPLTFDLVLAPDGMAVDASGTVIWNPTKKQVADYYAALDADNQFLIDFGRDSAVKTTVTFDVLLRVRDGKGGQNLQYIKVELLRDNTPPVFTSTPTANPQVGKTFRYQASALDAENNTLTYLLTQGAPTGVSINSTTGLVTWTPNSTQLGNQEFTIKVTDGKGDEALQKISLVVGASLPNTAPDITSTPRTVVRQGNTYFYKVEASDVDGNALNYSLATKPTGMSISNDGVISWTPTAAQFGNYTVKVNVSDGTVVTNQEFVLNVSNFAPNNAPTITSTPNKVTNLERAYQYNLTGSDPDNDLLLWSLDRAPEGMVIDATTGALRWQPSATQIGEHTVLVRATDAYGAYTGQEFTLTVRGTNTPPAIVSSPITIAAQNQVYTYNVVATDIENDEVTYSLGRRPQGMTINTEGKVEWKPTSSQIGSHTVEAVARDSQGATSTQTYTIEVGTVAINNAPTITSAPKFVALVGSPYQYQVTATDRDAGDTLTYQILSKPSGVDIQINSTTGLLTWDSPTAGQYQIVVGAVDAGGLGTAQGFTLTARSNNAPVINSTAVTNTTPGTAYSYDVKAVDADGDRITYSLDAESLGKGMTLDNLGRLRWNPAISNVGSHNVVINVADGNGGSNLQAYNLVVAADTIAPKVSLIALNDTVNLGDTITFQARATDNIKVAGLQLLVNGTDVVLDANGIGTVKATAAGTVRAIAKATDTAGNIGQATFDVFVVDPTDVEAPSVGFKLEGINDGDFVKAPTSIRATITDDGQIDYYRLLVAPVDGGEFKELWRNDNPTVINNGLLVEKFDPSLLQNDSYIVRLEVADNGGRISYSEQTVDVAGDLKLGNFRLSFTDLTVPVTGIPITLTRTYDTLTSGTTDDFGYGWRMEFRDTDLRTSVGNKSEEDEILGYQRAFKDGTKIYITLPGGKREAFTFKPTPDRIFKIAAGFAGANDSLVYNPSFVGDKGVTSTLTVKDARILRRADSNEYVGLNAGLPYNPADVNFGGIYVLTTKEGTVYEIDAATGDLLTVTDTEGNKLTYTDAEISSSTGQKITFARDSQNRITAVSDPMGYKVKYGYDDKGNLISVTDRENNVTTMEYNQERPHYLDKIIDPLGRTGVRNEYGDDGRLKKIVDVNGKPVEMTYDLDASEQKVTDQLGNVTTYVYDARGNVVTEIDAEGQITKRRFNDDNYILEKTVISDRSGVAGFTKKYSYDNFGNMLTESDPLGNVTYYTYGQYSRLLNEVDPLGNTTTYTYSPKGKLRSMTDASGNVTKYNYDLKGNVTEIVDVNGNKTGFRYDAIGNIASAIDANGNEITYTYDANGKVLSETQTVTTPSGLQQLVSERTYDREGRVKSIKDSENNITKYEYDDNGNQIAVINSRLNKTEYRYSEKGQLVEIIDPDNTPNNPLDNTRTITIYDEGGRSRATIDQNEKVTHYEYDALGRVTGIIYPSSTENTLAQLIATVAPGQTFDSIDWTKIVYPKETPAYLANYPKASTEYYQDGLVKADIDERGNRTEYRYNALGQLIETIYPDRTPQDLSDNPRTRSEYDKARRLISKTDALGHITSFVYDQLGRLKETKYSDGTSTITTFDALGHVIGRTDRAGRTTQYKYNSVGRLIETIYADDTPSNNEDNPKTRNEYDEIGRKIAFIDERGNRTEYEYDKAGRQTVIRDALDNETTYTYDKVGNILTITDALTHTTTYVYDERERLVKTQFADLTYTTTVYDNNSQVIAETDQNNQTAQYEYDSRGRLTDVVDARQQRTEYGYDLAGNLVSTKDANGHITTYEYDERDRRVATVLPLLQRSQTTYDAVGNVVTEKDFNQNTSAYRYDSNNRLIAKEFIDGTLVTYTYTKTGQVETVTDSRGVTIYKYDKRDRLISRTDPSEPHLETGATIEYEYDATGNRIAVKTKAGTTSHTYDELNRLKTVTQNTDTTTYFYDAVGNKRRTKLSNNIVETRQYDQLNRLVFLKNTLTNPVSGEETVVSGYDYTLNPVGYRLEVEEYNGRKVKYEYDELYRLLSEKITDPSDSINNGRTISYTYDNVGNRLTRNDSVEGLTTYYYNNNDLLVNETQLKNGETVYTYNYTYDNNGNTISRVKNGNSEIIYTWDFENRLIGVDNLLDGKQVDYVYDAKGVRVSSTSDGITTNYLVDTNLPHAQVLAEYENGNLKTDYLIGHDLISQTKEGQQSFYLVDGLGSTRVLTNAQALITDTYTYDAFGKLISSSGSTDNNYLFTGEQYDEDLEQYYLRQRYYDSNTGRFTRRDVYSGRLEEPLTLHKYLYANGNPVNLIDPSGLSALLGMSSDATWGISIVASIIAVVTAVRMLEIGIELGSYIPKHPKGFNEDAPKVGVPDNTARKPEKTLVHGILGRLGGSGGFGEGPQLEVSNTETFPSIPLSLSDLLENYIFSSAIDPNGPGTFHDSPRPLTNGEALSHAIRVYDKPLITKTRGSQAGPTGSTGHSRGKHDFPEELEVDIINNPERIFIGINDNGRQVTVFYRDGDAVITQDNDFTRVITAHGRNGRSRKPLDPDKWANNPNYVEITY